MPISQRTHGDITILAVSGKLGVGEGSNPLWATVQDLLEEGERRILLDLRGVGSVDSSGVGELMACHTSSRKRGGQLKVASLSPKLAQILQITQLSGVLETYPSEMEALAAFGV